jgi:hypothetical protein
MAAFDTKSITFTKLREWLTTISVAFSICATLFGVVKFCVSRIEEYDSYATRLAKLEARESAVHTLVDNAKMHQMEHAGFRADIDDLKIKIESMSTDVINLRLSDERIRTLLERRKR